MEEIELVQAAVMTVNPKAKIQWLGTHLRHDRSIPGHFGYMWCGDWIKFSPTTDSGDAFELAVRLGICINQGNEIAFAKFNQHQFKESYANHNGDKKKATRWAITKVAALITKEDGNGGRDGNQP